MDFVPTWLLLVLTFYLWGSVNHAILLARLAGKGDIRFQGSGNPGTVNALRVMGKAWALVVLLLDVGRGFCCAWLARRWLAGDWYPWAVSMAVLAGNLLPVFHRFRGGKGVATILGVVLGHHPAVAAIGLLVYVSVVAVFRISSLGSLCMLLSYPLSMWLLDAKPISIGFGVSLALIVFITHRANLQRLWTGREARVTRSPEPGPPSGRASGSRPRRTPPTGDRRPPRR